MSDALVSVLALITDGFGATGGIAQYNRDLLTALAASARVTSVTALPRFGTTTAQLPSKLRQLRAAPGRVAWCLRATSAAVTSRADVVFCGHLNAAPLAATLARATRSRLWVQAHGIEAWGKPGRLTRAALEDADLVTTVSRHTRRRLLQWADIDPSQVRVLPNTVAAAFAPKSRRPDLVARYGLGGRRVILTTGRIDSRERYKGHDRIIAALPGVVARCPDAAYLVVGAGDDVAYLRSEAEGHGVADRVVFAGQVAPDEIVDHFALAHVFAMPSTGEGFGIVFVEAARSGLPVVGGDRDGSTDALADGAIGCMIDPSSLPALTDALVAGLEGRLDHDPGRAERFVFANFRQHVDDLVCQLAI